jgi:hypothetical protein
MAAELRGLRARSMTDLAAVLTRCDAALALLSDERALLKRFESWPEARVDAMREAVAAHGELSRLGVACAAWLSTPHTASCDDDLRRIGAFADAAQRKIEALQRTADADERRFAEHGVPWERGALSAARAATASLAAAHMARVLPQAARLMRLPPSADGPGRAAELLAGAVRFAFRLHQFAGGFTPEAAARFAEVREALREAQAAAAAAAPPDEEGVPPDDA